MKMLYIIGILLVVGLSLLIATIPLTTSTIIIIIIIIIVIIIVMLR